MIDLESVLGDNAMVYPPVEAVIMPSKKGPNKDLLANRLQVTLTGPRLAELETCADILKDMGVEGPMTRQRVISCAMQVMIGFRQLGGVITYSFDDARTAED